MKQISICIGIFIALSLSRFIPHPPNFTSLLALSFYVPVIFGLRYLPALLISFAIRSTFGLFQIPIAEQFLWARSEFSMAIAIQNLAWGIGTPIFSAFAEKFGDRKAITLGLILYAIGIFISSTASTPEAHQFLNVLIGFGIAGSGLVQF